MLFTIVLPSCLPIFGEQRLRRDPLAHGTVGLHLVSMAVRRVLATTRAGHGLDRAPAGWSRSCGSPAVAGAYIVIKMHDAMVLG